MTRPAGVTAKTKDNSKKKFREREEWQKGKKIGRPKQKYVDGRWEKVS
jgi:hypothetical protein